MGLHGLMFMSLDNGCKPFVYLYRPNTQGVGLRAGSSPESLRRARRGVKKIPKKELALVCILYKCINIHPLSNRCPHLSISKLAGSKSLGVMVWINDCQVRLNDMRKAAAGVRW